MGGINEKFRSDKNGNSRNINRKGTKEIPEKEIEYYLKVATQLIEGI